MSNVPKQTRLVPKRFDPFVASETLLSVPQRNQGGMHQRQGRQRQEHVPHEQHRQLPGML